MVNLKSTVASGRVWSMSAGQSRSRIFKRSIVIAGHKTSISLESEFWQSLKEIAGRRNIRLSELVASIDTERAHANLSSAIRVFVLGVYRLEFEATHGRRPPLKEPSTPSARSASPSRDS